MQRDGGIRVPGDRTCVSRIGLIGGKATQLWRTAHLLLAPETGPLTSTISGTRGLFRVLFLGRFFLS